MAYDDEVLPEAPPEPVVPEGTHRIYLECRMSGDPDPRYLDAVVRFVRRHLVSDEPKARVHLAGPGRMRPARRNGVDIIVDPRSIVGRLQISTTVGHWDAGRNSCIHVVRTAGVTTLVINEQSFWIK